MQVQIHRSVEPKLRQMMARQQRSGSWLVARMIEWAPIDVKTIENAYRDAKGNLHYKKRAHAQR